MTKFAKRINSFSNSIFGEMSELTREYNAINLGQGFPNMPGPNFVKEAAREAIANDFNQYAPPDGVFSLRKLIAANNQKYFNTKYSPNYEITITAGATEAIFSTIHAFIESGDEVILFEPFYDAHDADVLLAGGTPRYVTLHKPDFTFDADELRKTVNKKTKMIIINTPHNPTGKVFSEEELTIIANIAKEYDLIVMADEVYEYITYEKKHISIASLPEMKERTITISSCGKTFGMTGWKVGYVCTNGEFTRAIRKVHQWTIFSINTPGQHGFAEGFRQLDTYLPKKIEIYKNKRDLAIEILKDSPFKPMNCYGAFYLMVDLPKGVYANDVDAAQKLIRNQRVATIPPSSFYKKSDEGKSMLRICFAKDDDSLKDGLMRLQK
ncbi:MAG: aminotransferase [Bacteroidetes bacterium 4572_77]|nr:MAG: aminotransferase [Bacteroidetes bacterium 4572_77]